MVTHEPKLPATKRIISFRDGEIIDDKSIDKPIIANQSKEEIGVFL